MNLTAAGRTMQLLKRICNTKSATEPILRPTAAKISIPLAKPERPLERTVPEAQGVPSSLIEQFLSELQRGEDLSMHSVLILRNGTLLCEAAFGAQRTDVSKHTFSACKSIVSLAIGLLHDDGLISADTSVANLFPELLTSVSARRLRNLTVEHLLTMRSGISFSEPQSAAESHWLRSALNSSLLFEPGGEFHYNSFDTYLLSAIVCRLSGESMCEFLKKRLFDPMGISGILWERSEDNIEKGGWGLYICPEDMAKLGQLVMNGGEWQGTRLISREYLSAALFPHVSPPAELGDFDYGYQIWVGRESNTFLFNGMFGQNVLGFRDSGILIVSNAGADTDFQKSRYFEIARRCFGGTFLPSLPADRRAYDRLLRKTCSLSFYNHRTEAIGPEAAPFLGRSFVACDPHAASAGLLPLFLQALHNCYSSGLVSVSVGAEDLLPEITYREQDATHRFTVGLGRPSVSELSFSGNCFHVAAHGRFTHDEEERPVFYIRLEFLETPSVRILKLVLTEEGAILKHGETPGIPFLYRKFHDAAPRKLLRPLLLITTGGSDETCLTCKLQRIFSPEIRMLPEE